MPLFKPRVYSCLLSGQRVLDKIAFLTKTSCDLDGISLKQLKYMKCLIIESLTLIVKQILHAGIFLNNYYQ